jgi:hypothetical protein
MQKIYIDTRTMQKVDSKLRFKSYVRTCVDESEAKKVLSFLARQRECDIHNANEAKKILPRTKTHLKQIERVIKAGQC